MHLSAEVLVHLSADVLVHLSGEVGPADGGGSGRGLEVGPGSGEDAKWMYAPRRGQGPLTHPRVRVVLESTPTNFSTLLSQSKKEKEKSPESKV